jgi:hypothetical protein
MRDFRAQFETDPRFRAVADERQREDWFYAAVDRRADEEKEAKRAARKRALADWEGVLRAAQVRCEKDRTHIIGTQ